MNEKHELESFVSNIDKIISGEVIVAKDKEYDELLKLAQFLAKADFHPPSSDMMKKIWEIMSKKGELEDDDLDMVAGGLNTNAILDEKDKRNGI